MSPSGAVVVVIAISNYNVAIRIQFARAGTMYRRYWQQVAVDVVAVVAAAIVAPTGNFPFTRIWFSFVSAPLLHDTHLN